MFGQRGRFYPPPPYLLLFAGLLAVLTLLLLAGAAAGQTEPPASDSSCARCHGDQARLETLSESWQKVYVDPARYEAEAVHHGLDCTVCHGGDPTQEDPALACIGQAHKNPAAAETVKTTCGQGGCHPDITTRHLNSLHTSLEGIRLSLVDLLGEAEGMARFEGGCNKCHASCAECHVEEPGAHGLLYPRVESHRFAPKPAADNCWTCHGGTGDTFFGEHGSDSHGPSLMAQAGLGCSDCHGEREVHGSGSRTSFIMESPKPECETCHRQPERRVTTTRGVTVAPQYNPEHGPHRTHEEDVSCVACHTNWYPSCWNCHEGRASEVSYELFLVENPLTGEVHTAAHSPATGPDWGPIPAEIGGGWAVKSRHSWGAAQSCETCHTSSRTYIEGVDRQAPFVGYWSEKRAGAGFVPEELVQWLVIDQDRHRQDVHGQASCNDCHASLADDVCAACHNRSEKSGTTLLPPEADWSRNNFILARDSLEQVEAIFRETRPAGSGFDTWQRQWAGLKERYLAAANKFHGSPGEAQMEMPAIAAESQALLMAVYEAVQTRQVWRETLVTGLPLLLGLAGAGALGLVLYRPKRKRGKS